MEKRTGASPIGHGKFSLLKQQKREKEKEIQRIPFRWAKKRG